MRRLQALLIGAGLAVSPAAFAHPNPDKAMSDGGQSLFPDQLARLVRETRAIAEAIGRSLAAPPGTGPSARG